MASRVSKPPTPNSVRSAQSGSNTVTTLSVSVWSPTQTLPSDAVAREEG